jgi:hypothetical protein
MPARVVNHVAGEHTGLAEAKDGAGESVDSNAWADSVREVAAFFAQHLGKKATKIRSRLVKPVGLARRV